MSGQRRVEIRGQHRLLNDFFKIDEVTVAHQRYDGTMSADERRLVFERGDAIAVLLFDKQTRSVVTVEQFRLPALIARRRKNPKPIGTFFSSPGGSSERFFLYCALVSAARCEGRGSGLAGEEDIKVFPIAVEDLFDQLAAGTIEDPKLAIAGYWLKDNIDRL